VSSRTVGGADTEDQRPHCLNRVRYAWNSERLGS
jgi:hypothetical protein